MSPDNPALVEFIRDRIRREGPVSFSWFMEQALYHPEHGYYASGKAAIGRHGDYFTNVSVGPLFGKLMAAQFREMWDRMGRPGQFTIVEQGANNGDFAKDVLTALQSGAPDFLAALDYVIVEPFASLRERQHRTLEQFPQADWRGSLDHLEPFTGVHFSNELLDAMPVHLVKFTGGEWKERYVDWQAEAFCFVEEALSDGRLPAYLAKLPQTGLVEYTAEINLEALDWIESLAGRLISGYVLAVDYGHPRDVLYDADHSTGTLAVYSEHKRTDDPLYGVGNRDITTHVDFTSLAERAGESGFQVIGFTDQHHFIVGLGKGEFSDTDDVADPERMKSLRAFKTLMHPTLMGTSFKFLGLEKHVSGDSAGPLGGFQFGGLKLAQ